MAQILVVDDDAVSALVIARALTQVGHGASIARSGLQALEQLEAGGFDAVVTDWMMKELDGLELIRRVQLRFSPPPVTIMVTSLDTPQAREHALESGADEFLTKPIRPREVIEVLERCLARRRSQGAMSDRVTGPFASVIVPALAPARLPLVVIGANAGGPRALRIVLRSLPPESKDVAFVVAQHAQAQMVEALLPMLARETSLQLVMATQGQRLEPGVMLIAPGGRHVSISETGDRIELDDAPEMNHVRPSADKLFTSAGRAIGPSCVAIVLTGMGCDATEGSRRVRAAGGTVLVVTPGAHVASGMAESAMRAGVASSVVPLEQLGAALGRSLQPLIAAARAAGALPGASAASAPPVLEPLAPRPLGELALMRHGHFLRRAETAKSAPAAPVLPAERDTRSLAVRGQGR